MTDYNNSSNSSINNSSNNSNNSSSSNENNNNSNSNVISQELLDILNSLADTFINESNYSSFEDLFMSIEEAYWYYIDIHLIQNPRLSKPDLQNFAELILVLQNNERLLPFHTALLTASTYSSMVKKFEAFKRLIPKYGAIIMNKDMTKVVLVKEQWWGWGFPKGKGKEGETETQSAAREVFEEIGFDISSYIKKDAFIQKESHGVIKKFFIIIGVDEMTDFETHTRYEISRIKWHQIEDLPIFRSRQSHQFAAIIPYVKPLLNWIDDKRKDNGLEPIHKLRSNENQQSGTGGGTIGGDQTLNYKWTPYRNKIKNQGQTQQQILLTVDDDNDIILNNEIDCIYLTQYIDEFKSFLNNKQLSSSGNNTPKLNSTLYQQGQQQQQQQQRYYNQQQYK